MPGRSSPYGSTCRTPKRPSTSGGERPESSASPRRRRRSARTPDHYPERVSTSQTLVFVGRLAGLQVFDPAGDQVGRVRDLVSVLRPGNLRPRVLGLVVDVLGRRSVFLPITRVTSIDSGHVITTGLVNMRRFEQRPSETQIGRAHV